MLSVSRLGDATEPLSRWSRPMTIGAFSSPLRDHLVEREAERVALAEAQPADARRQALERDALAAPCRASGAGARRRGNSSLTFASVRVMSSGSPDSATQRNGPLPSQNSGRMYAGTKPGKSNAFVDALVLRHLADVVAVVERRDALAWKPSIALDVHRHRLRRAAVATLLRVVALRASRHCSSVQPSGQVAVDGIVRGGLVGDERRRTRRRARFTISGTTSAALPSSADRDRLACAACRDAGRAPRPGRSPARRGSACAGACRCALGSALDREHRRAGHRRGERLRAAHAAEAGGENPLAGPVRRRSACGRPRRTSRTCPARCPACRCRSS